MPSSQQNPKFSAVSGTEKNEICGSVQTEALPKGYEKKRNFLFEIMDGAALQRFGCQC
jgi:hypothetical protein